MVFGLNCRHAACGFLFRSVAGIPATLLFILVVAGAVFGVDSIDRCTLPELTLYLELAEASEQAYDDSQAGLTSTPSGCVALVKEDKHGNLIIAFRGSMLGDRNPRHRFSSFGGANMKRNYRDWVATNLKQTAGFLPRQYTEAASLVEELLSRHPLGKKVYVTGHSKGGGAATYAFAAAHAANVRPESLERMHAVTFNAAVVKEQNWRRLLRGPRRGGGTSRTGPPPNSIDAVIMADDPVSKIAAAEERDYIRRIRIVPEASLSPAEQHGILAVIEEIRSRREKKREGNPSRWRDALPEDQSGPR